MSDERANETAPTAAGAHASQLGAGARLGRYEVVDFIGGGGMGWVYRVKDTELEREVAVKVVQPAVAGPAGRERLLAEARTMAKLRHRAVVPVFDVGEHEGGVYIAMELVTGGTLHDWMHAEPRPWRAVLTRFLDAGRGLVAAHAAGIVHRDFKPRNVLLGASGDVLVADFGIASVGAADEADGDGPRDVSRIVGTPAYMAPEQAAGQPVDARADQYSFCVSLWEGLHGERPQEAETRTQGAVLARSHEAPKARRAVPGWLSAAVARGFAPQPERRWPTMAALIAYCERGLGRRRRWLLAGGGLALAATTATVIWVQTRPAAGPTCELPQDRIDAVWTAARGQALRAKLVAIDPARGVALANRAIGTFDTYMRQWGDSAVTACRDTRIERTQSEGLLSKRMACLDQALVNVSATIGALENTDERRALDSRFAMLDSLPQLELCAESAQLAAQPGPPTNPKEREEYQSLAQELASIDVARLTGQIAEHKRRVIAAVVRARTLGHPRLLARALDQLGAAMHNEGNYAAEVKARREAISVAAGGRDDTLVADLWTVVVSIVADYLEKPDEADSLLLSAEAAIARVGNPPRFRVDLLRSKASIAKARRDFTTALAVVEEAIALLEKEGARRPATELANRMFMAVAERGALLMRLHRHKEAVTAFEDAVALVTAKYDASHAYLGPYLGNLSQAYLKVGDVDAGVAAMKRALTISERTLGESGRLATMYWGLGETLIMTQRFDEALPYTARAADMGRKTLEPDDRRLADILGSHGAALVETGDVDAGLTVIDESLAIYAKGKPSLNGGLTEYSRADALARARRWADALASYERAGALLEGVAGPKSAEVLDARLGAAVVWARQENWARVVTVTERLLRDPFENAAAGLARAHFWHGLALVRLKRGGGAARAEVETAAATLRADAGTSKAVLADVEAGLVAIAAK